jgi:hypothetical protein
VCFLQNTTNAGGGDLTTQLELVSKSTILLVRSGPTSVVAFFCVGMGETFHADVLVPAVTALDWSALYTSM